MTLTTTVTNASSSFVVEVLSFEGDDKLEAGMVNEALSTKATLPADGRGTAQIHNSEKGPAPESQFLFTAL